MVTLIITARIFMRQKLNYKRLKKAAKKSRKADIGGLEVSHAAYQNTGYLQPECKKSY